MSDVTTTDARGWLSKELLATSRRVTQWTFAAIRVLLLLACVFLISWVVNYNPVSWDLTEEQLFSISEQSRAVIADLDEPITLTAFVQGGRNAGIERTLMAYAEASPQVDYRLVDPEAQPALAAEFQVREFGTLIVEGAERVQRADGIEEPAITNAILKVDRGAAVPICFLVGHGERSPASKEREGLSAAATALGQTNYEIRQLNLGVEGEVPTECEVVILAGPTSDILPAERQALEGYMDQGGRLLAMLESRVQVPQISTLLGQYGIEVGNDFVIDTRRNGQAVGLGIQAPMVDEYAAHPITDSFRMMTLYNLPRSLRVAEDAPETLDVRPLATSSRSSWGETKYDRTEAVTWDEGEDVQGPLPLVVAVGEAVEESPAAFRQRMREGEPKPVGEPLVVATGDVDFAANALFNFQGNGDLLLNSVNWLAGQQELISIRPKRVANKRIVLTDSRKALSFGLLVILLPMIPAVAGVVIMLKRVK